MLEIFQYDFMRNAFITGILIAIIAPCIGITIVFRRLSMIGDSLSHASLAGVAAGLIAGINPILGAIVFSLIASLGIEKVRKIFPRYSELSTAIILSTGVGLAGVLSGFVSNSTDFTSFLFGSIVTISDFEVILVSGLSVMVLLTTVLLYKELFYITFDEQSARLAGIPVRVINLVFILITAITISISSKTIGTLVISSLLVLPVAAAMQISKSYKQTLVYAILIAVISTITGLFVSFYGNLKPGGTIVLISVFILLLIVTVKSFAPHSSLKSK